MNTTHRKPLVVSKKNAAYSTNNDQKLKAMPYPFPLSFSKSFSEHVNKRFLSSADIQAPFSRYPTSVAMEIETVEVLNISRRR